MDHLDARPLPSHSASPAGRLPSRSPHPYHRSSCSFSTNPTTLCMGRTAHLPSPALTPDTSRTPSPFPRKQTSCGGSESGTEADDELAQKLPAPRKRTSSEEEKYYAEEEGDELFEGESDERGRRRKNVVDVDRRFGVKKRRRGIVFVRRGIEIALMGVLVAVVLSSRDGRIWKEVVLRRQEFAIWAAVLLSSLLLYPLRILLGGAPLELPRSLDPSPLLYPIFFPIMVALSMTEEDPDSRNPYLVANMILSLSSTPPVLTPSWNVRWVISILPLALPLLFSRVQAGMSGPEELSVLPLLRFALGSVLTHLLHPSLTRTEIRMISSALINLNIYASSPQATILKGLLWGGGLGTLILCEDVVKWNVNLARVPSHRLRRTGNAIISIGRMRKLAVSKFRDQASDSEGDVPKLTRLTRSLKARPPSARSFYTSLTYAQARTRRFVYSSWVYGCILGIVMLGLRRYIRNLALEGVDPFIWASGYLLCGQGWYHNVVDMIAPGSGYCVTEGSTPAANLRLIIIAYWAVVLMMGITLVTAILTRIQVDTRRKVFHGMVVIMFLIPGTLDPPFTYLCLSLALAAFLLLDAIRAGQLPPFSGKIAVFLEPFVDGRDLKGPVVVSHVFLLLGCAVGWWLTLAASSNTDKGDAWDWSERRVELAFVSGVVCVGLGDAAASLIGRRFGNTKWGWRGGKSLEGSLAFAIAVMTGLSVGRWWIGGAEMRPWPLSVWAKIAAVGVWGSLVEAVVTGVNDNIVLPVGAWIVVRGLGL